MDMIGNRKSQIWIISVLVLAAVFLTYYFQNVLKTGQLYTHFFYIPIIFACIWWKRKGLYVTLGLLIILLFSQMLFFQYRPMVDDFIRALMLAFASLIIVGLSEALSGVRKQLFQSEIMYRTIFETTGTAMVIIEEDTTISLVNSEFENLSGYPKKEIENKKRWTEFVAEEHLEYMKAYHQKRRKSAESAPKKYEFSFKSRNKGLRDILVTIDVIPGTLKSVASFSDITELKQTLKREKELQAQLSTALAKVLGGFIPICANCKKIRNEQNDWIQIESFLSEKTEADFSHGICPQCARKLYADFFPEEEKVCVC